MCGQNNSEPCGNFRTILRHKLPIIHPDLPKPTRSPNSSVQPEFLNPKFLYKTEKTSRVLTAERNENPCVFPRICPAAFLWPVFRKSPQTFTNDTRPEVSYTCHGPSGPSPQGGPPKGSWWRILSGHWMANGRILGKTQGFSLNRPHQRGGYTSWWFY